MACLSLRRWSVWRPVLLYLVTMGVGLGLTWVNLHLTFTEDRKFNGGRPDRDLGNLGDLGVPAPIVDHSNSNSGGWVFRSGVGGGGRQVVNATQPWEQRQRQNQGQNQRHLDLHPAESRRFSFVSETADSSTRPSSSPYLLAKGTTPTTQPKTSKTSAEKDHGVIKTVSFYDPLNEQPSTMSTDFSVCPFSRCQMTRDVTSADVVIFLATQLKAQEVPSFPRRPEQIWVFKTDEAPSRFSWFDTLDRAGLKSAMNWTITHKLDSDIPTPYGMLVELKEEGTEKSVRKDKDYEEIFRKKNKMAAWFVSHCPVRSRRMWYVERMRRRMDVDIFGRCGDKRCGMAEKVKGVTGMRRRADNTTCFPMLSDQYKFYLAFENSLCQEYITEKFFKLFQGVDVVPVVRGGADYRAYFPGGLFVDADDFDSPEALADHLEDLAQDQDRYIRYLKNKDRYQLIPASGNEAASWRCRLCEKIHTSNSKTRQNYENIREWFTSRSCHDPMDSEELF